MSASVLDSLSKNAPITMCGEPSRSISKFQSAQYFATSSYNHLWSMIQRLTKDSMSSWMDLSCQNGQSFLSLAHALKLPDDCMLMYVFGETSFIWPFLATPMMPPASPPWFRLFRNSSVFACLQLARHHIEGVRTFFD